MEVATQSEGSGHNPGGSSAEGGGGEMLAHSETGRFTDSLKSQVLQLGGGLLIIQSFIYRCLSRTHSRTHTTNGRRPGSQGPGMKQEA